MSATVLLVLDVQQAIVDRVADSGYLGRLCQAVRAARESGIPVIHVTIGFRPGHPEVGAGNKLFGPMKQRGTFTTGDPGTRIHPDVAPLPGEIVVSRPRASAFAGSDLEIVLRAADAGHLVLAGIATSGVVLSTVRQAADMDYELTVLSDGCDDPDPEVHRVLTEKVFPRQADVVTVSEWVAVTSPRTSTDFD